MDNQDISYNCVHCKNSKQQYCHIPLEDLSNLKESTIKLLALLEEIHAKTHYKQLQEQDVVSRLANLTRVNVTRNIVNSLTDVIGRGALNKLENNTKELDGIYLKDEDNCSVYKRLTRKCHCLNKKEYNDLIIHFNEDVKYFTSNMGEIIKNMRILKKFLYMGGDYTKNSLTFLNEGLTDLSRSEKVEIIQGCSHADICNVFDDNSIVTFWISWPCKYEGFGDALIQIKAAEFLYFLSQVEEGRRYLRLSSKITNDIKKTIRKKATHLDENVLDLLKSTINLLHPPLSEQVNLNSGCKSVDEGTGNKTLNYLVQYREHMTTEEVFTYLDILNNWSVTDSGKKELLAYFPKMLSLFKHMLTEFDNSEMNIVVTNILNNIVTKSMMKDEEDISIEMASGAADSPADKLSLPAEQKIMKNESSQIPYKKQARKIKSKLGLGNAPKSHSPARGPTKKKHFEWNAREFNRSKQLWDPRELNRSKNSWGIPASINLKKGKNDGKKTIIFVPIEN